MVLLSLLACTGDTAPEELAALSVVDRTLDAIVGEPYTGQIEVTGGTPPYQLELTGDLPEGLIFLREVRYDWHAEKQPIFRRRTSALHDSNPHSVLRCLPYADYRLFTYGVESWRRTLWRQTIWRQTF